MEELTSWIFSSEEAVEVAMQMPLTLFSDLRIKGDMERFVKELLSDAQKHHFQLLLSGFCRKFSTLAQESYESNIPTYRKAAFSVARTKFLSNFHPGKSTQERMIVQRILKNENDKFSAAGIMSVIHERVYSVIHDRVRLRKAETENTGTCKARSHLKEESSDILYRYCGAPLHRMIKLREQTIAGKKGRGESSDKRKPVTQKELEILSELLMKDKSNIPASLKTLNEGNVKFPEQNCCHFSSLWTTRFASLRQIPI